MKKLKLLPLLLTILLSVSLLPSPAMALTPPDIGAQSAILINADTGEVYYEKAADTAIQPGSIAKIMTALLVAEASEKGGFSMTSSVTAYDDCAYNLDESSSTASPAIQPGETMTVEDLLYCAILASANEACNILAEYTSGSVSDFVSAMNSRAAELGCANTRFANANGLPSDDSTSSARELATITREALSHSSLRQICSATNRTVAATNVAGERSLANSNSLLISDSGYYYDGAYGVRAGYLDSTGYCLAAAARRGDLDVIAIILNASEQEQPYIDAGTLFDWFFNNYESRQVLSTSKTIMTADVVTGTAATVDVRAEDSISITLPRDYDTSSIKLYPVLTTSEDGHSLEAPISAGDVLGEVTVVEVDGSGNVTRVLGSSRLIAATSVEMSRGNYVRGQLSDLLEEPIVHRILLILGILLIVYILLVLFYRIQRLRHVHSMRRARRDRALRQAREDAQWLTIPEEEESDPQIEFFDDEEPEDEPPRRGRRR